MTTYQATPDFYNDYISHHGVKGMKWGVRRKKEKEIKEKAKKYQKEMNNLQSKETSILYNTWIDSEDYGVVRNEIERLKSKQTKVKKEKKQAKIQKKIDKLLIDQKIRTKKIGQLQIDYKKNRKKIDSLLKTLEKDKDVLYKVDYSMAGNSEYDKNIKKKYKLSRSNITPNGRSVWGSSYKVVPNTKRNSKKKKYSDPNNKREKDRRFVETTYY